MTSGGDFAAFVREASEPATAPTLPEPHAPDIPRLMATAAKHGLEILGPLPG